MNPEGVCAAVVRAGLFCHSRRPTCLHYYPAPYRGYGILFSIDFFVYFLVSLSARLRDKIAVLSQR